MHGQRTGERAPCRHAAAVAGAVVAKPPLLSLGAQRVGRGGWYWRGPHHIPRAYPRAPDLESALANAGLEAFGDPASEPVSEPVREPVMRYSGWHLDPRALPGGTYLDNADQEEEEDDDEVCVCVRVCVCVCVKRARSRACA